MTQIQQNSESFNLAPTVSSAVMAHGAHSVPLAKSSFQTARPWAPRSKVLPFPEFITNSVSYLVFNSAVYRGPAVNFA